MRVVRSWERVEMWVWSWYRVVRGLSVCGCLDLGWMSRVVHWGDVVEDGSR